MTSENTQTSTSAPVAGVPMPDADAVSKNYDLIIEAARRERDFTSARASSTQTRAGVLIGAAGILGGTELLSDTDALRVTTLALYLIAAAIGLWVMVPGRVVPPKLGHWYAMSSDIFPLELKQRVVEEELCADKAAARRVTVRSWWVIGGFVVLVAGWVLAAIVGLTSADDVEVVRVQLVP